MPYEPNERPMWTDKRINDTKNATPHADKYLTVVMMIMMIVKY